MKLVNTQDMLEVVVVGRSLRVMHVRVPKLPTPPPCRVGCSVTCILLFSVPHMGPHVLQTLALFRLPASVVKKWRSVELLF